MISEITSIQTGANPANIFIPAISHTNRKIVEIEGGVNPSSSILPYKYTQLSVNDVNSLGGSIEKLYIGENVKKLYVGGTKSKLKEIKFKSPDLSSITGTTFDGATNLSCVEGLKDTKISALSPSCFYQCSSLASVSLPPTITTIGESCFHGCSSLSSVSLPPTITTIGSACFSNTDISVNDVLSSLTEISDLPASTFSNLKNTVSDNSHITIPTKITSIRNECFRGCNFIKDVTFKKAAIIGWRVFSPYHASGELSAIYFYRGLTDEELANDTSLTAEPIPEINKDAFEYIPNDIEISVYVPTYMYDNWTKNTSWKNIRTDYRHVIILPYNGVYPPDGRTLITLDDTKSYVIVDKNFTSVMNANLNSTNDLATDTDLSAIINVYMSSDPAEDEIDDSAFNSDD